MAVGAPRTGDFRAGPFVPPVLAPDAEAGPVPRDRTVVLRLSASSSGRTGTESIRPMPPGIGPDPSGGSIVLTGRRAGQGRSPVPDTGQLSELVGSLSETVPGVPSMSRTRPERAL